MPAEKLVGEEPLGALKSVLERGRSLGFLGSGSIDRHIAHALGFVAAYQATAQQRLKSQAQPLAPRSGARPAAPDGLSPSRLVDLGSGVGLPGIVLAMFWRTCEVQLVEASSRRVQFLEDGVSRCGLVDQVTIQHDRAETVARQAAIRGRQDLVVARSFAGPSATAECAAPMLGLGGLLIVSEPPPAKGDSRHRWPAEGVAQLGLEDVGMVRQEFGYRVFRAAQLCPERFPRRAGVPEKRPLF